MTSVYERRLISKHHFFREALLAPPTGTGTPAICSHGIYTAFSIARCYPNHRIFADVGVCSVSAFLRQSQVPWRKALCRVHHSVPGTATRHVPNCSISWVNDKTLMWPNFLKENLLFLSLLARIHVYCMCLKYKLVVFTVSELFHHHSWDNLIQISSRFTSTNLIASKSKHV